MFIKSQLLGNLMRVITMVALSLFATSAFGDKGGLLSVDTTWSKVDSPHIVSSGVIVGEGVRLTIEAGAEIQLCGTCGILVEGTLDARGLEADPIKFGPGAGFDSWGRLLFKSTSVDGEVDAGGVYLSGSVVEHAHFADGGDIGGNFNPAFSGTVQTQLSHPLLRDLRIERSASNGLYMVGIARDVVLSGITATDSDGDGFSAQDLEDNLSVTIRLSEFSRSSLSGVTFARNSILTGVLMVVEDSTFADNGEYGVDVINGVVQGNRFLRNGTELFSGGSIVINTGTVSKNVVSVSRGTGISVSHSASGSLSLEDNILIDSDSDTRSIDMRCNLGPSCGRRSVTMARNIVANNESGTENLFFIEGGNDQTIEFSNNHVIGNSVSADLMARFSGINTSGSGLFKNLFANNRALKDDAGVSRSVLLTGLGFITAQPFAVTGNQFLDSEFRYRLGTTYRQDRTPTVDVAGNWWGTTTESVIEDLILDFNQDNNLTRLEFRAPLAAPSQTAPMAPPVNLQVSVQGPGQVQLNWETSPGRTPVDYRVYWGNEDAPFYTNSLDVGNVTEHLLNAEGFEGTYFVAVTALSATDNLSLNQANTPVNENQTQGHESWFARGVANPLDVSATTHDYGDVNTGDTKTQSFNVTNRGYNRYRVSNLGLSGDVTNAFDVTEDSCTAVDLMPGESCTFSITFAPTDPGAKNAQVDIQPQATGQSVRTINLTGNAVAVARMAVSPATIDAGIVLLGSQSSRDIIIENTGTATLELQAPVLDGDHLLDFGVSGSGTCASIGPGSSCTLGLTFNPSMAGDRVATLALQSNAVVNGSRGVPLTGEGVEPVSITHLAASPNTGEAPLDVDFTAAAVGGRGGLVYNWDLGDGTAALGQSVNHRYPEVGRYEVTVIASDSGLEGNASMSTVSVEAVEPGATYVPVTISNASAEPLSGVAPLAVDFTVVPEGGSGNYDISWNFGDTATATGASVTHSFDVGIFNVTATIVDREDANNKATVEWEVEARQPALSIETLQVDRSRGTVPFDAAFTVEARGGSGNYTYSWDFGDGSTTVEGAQATHSYQTAGTFTAAVTVTDTTTGNTLKGDTVVQAAEPPEDFSPIFFDNLGSDVLAGVAPLNIALSANLAGGSGGYELEWDFGDGNTAVGASPTHSYADAGTYTVTVLAQDSADAFNTASGSFDIVVVSAPESLGVSVSAEQLNDEPPVNVEFTVNLQSGTLPLSLQWDFGDGETLTETLESESQSSTHSYAQSGSYVATLTLASGVGAESQAVELPMSIEVDARGLQGDNQDGSQVAQPGSEQEASSGGGGSVGFGSAVGLLLLALGAAWSRRRPAVRG